MGDAYNKTWTGKFYNSLPYIGYTALALTVVGGVYYFWYKPMNDRHQAKKAKDLEEARKAAAVQLKAASALNKSPDTVALPDESDDSSWEIIVIIVIILLVPLLLGYFGYTAYKGTGDEDEDDEDLESPEEK